MALNEMAAGGGGGKATARQPTNELFPHGVNQRELGAASQGDEAWRMGARHT